MSNRVLVLVVALAIGAPVRSSLASVAQSGGPEAQENDIARAKEIIQQLRAGKRLAPDELDVLEYVLLGIDQPGGRDVTAQGKGEPGVNPSPPAVHQTQPQLELSAGSSTREASDDAPPAVRQSQGPSVLSAPETNPKSYYQGDVVIQRLYAGPEEIGSITWIRRGPDRIRAKYFASGNVYQRYSAFDKPTVLACEGAFSITSGNNGNLLPEGLTVDDGVIVNRDLSSKMDGLVFVYATGGIMVADIGDGNLTVKDDTGQQTLDVRNSRDKTYLLNWAVRNRATMFQTQLLASTRGLRLDIAKAHREFRERRFLAIVKDKQTNEVKHVIIDVSKPYYLGDLAQLVYSYLETQATVIALLNLEGGTNYNVLDVYDQNRQRLSYPTGMRPASTATALLVYYDAR